MNLLIHKSINSLVELYNHNEKEEDTGRVFSERKELKRSAYAENGPRVLMKNDACLGQPSFISERRNVSSQNKKQRDTLKVLEPPAN